MKPLQVVSYPVSASLPPPLSCLASTHVPVALVNPHPPLPFTHTLHTWMHTGMRGEWHNPPNAKTWWAWSAPCSTAVLMNGHSGTQTKLRLDAYYTVGSRVTQSTDRSRNQRWMPGSLFQTPSHSDAEIHAHQNTLWGKIKHTHKNTYSSLFISTTWRLHLHRLYFVGHTRAVEQEEWGSNTEIIKAHKSMHLNTSWSPGSFALLWWLWRLEERGGGKKKKLCARRRV